MLFVCYGGVVIFYKKSIKKGIQARPGLGAAFKPAKAEMVNFSAS